MHEFEHIIHFERGLLYTLKQLALRSAQSIRGFIEGDRQRMTKPLIFSVLCGVAYSFVNKFVHFSDVTQDADFKEIYPIMQWLVDHYGYFHLLLSLITALWLRVFFRKNPYNFFELIILLCYVMGFAILINLVVVFPEKYLNMGLLGTILELVYLSWSIGQFFGNKWTNYLKACIVCILSFILLMVLLLSTALLVKLF
ncbi:MAG: DUF3667 domain-containing protein [Bacteroidota bacterium]|nr:DUF3667 domain-containing protein [Bacteroidota bacterium]